MINILIRLHTLYVRKFDIRAKISRAMTIPTTMVLNPSPVKTMSAAALAASVAPFTAIPTSARFNAGASLTPSPVHAIW